MLLCISWGIGWFGMSVGIRDDIFRKILDELPFRSRYVIFDHQKVGNKHQGIKGRKLQHVISYIDGQTEKMWSNWIKNPGLCWNLPQVTPQKSQLKAILSWQISIKSVHWKMIHSVLDTAIRHASRLWNSESQESEWAMLKEWASQFSESLVNSHVAYHHQTVFTFHH